MTMTTISICVRTNVSRDTMDPGGLVSGEALAAAAQRYLDQLTARLSALYPDAEIEVEAGDVLHTEVTVEGAPRGEVREIEEVVLASVNDVYDDGAFWDAAVGT